jgi:hypothetical protein
MAARLAVFTEAEWEQFAWQAKFEPATVAVLSILANEPAFLRRLRLPDQLGGRRRHGFQLQV